MSDLLEHGDGVYIGLAEDRYHRDPALGSTDLKNLYISPATYWIRSKYSPIYEDVDTPARKWGRAFHSLVLEGPAAFQARYARGPRKADYPGLLVTMNDMKAWLAARGYATSGTKPDLVKRVLGVDPRTHVWDAIEAGAEAAAAGREILDAKTYDEINLSSRLITKVPTLRNAFAGGFPEISIFWTVDGVRFKARFDYLKLKTINDLKSFRNIRDKPVERSVISDNIFGRRYDLQAAQYLEARAQMPRLLAEGRVFGEGDLDLLRKIVAFEGGTFTWIFCEAPNGAITRPVIFEPGSAYHGFALTDIRIAVENFKRGREMYGMRDIWLDESTPVRLADEDVPQFHAVGRV